MAAFTIVDASQAEPTPHKNLLLRILDALAEWPMREELRIINRSQPTKSDR